MLRRFVENSRCDAEKRAEAPRSRFDNKDNLDCMIHFVCLVAVVRRRFVEKNRREVEEKTEQLKAISNISALFALCAVVNLTQLNVKVDADPAPPLVRDRR